MEAINIFSQHVNSKLEIGKVFNAALKGMHEFIMPDFSYLFLRDGQKLIINNILPLSKQEKYGTLKDHFLGDCICGMAASLKKPLFSPNIFKDKRCTLDECKLAKITSFAALPLLVNDETDGVIGLASYNYRDFELQAGFLETMARQVSIALLNAKLHEDLKKELDMRKSVEEKLNKQQENLEIKVAERTNQLEEKNRTLQRINKAFVGRELRMIELKKEIEKLKNG